MIQKVSAVVLLLGTIITGNVADPLPVNGVQKSTTNKKIFQPPGNSTIDQIADTSTPWVLPELVPIIEEYKKNVFEDLKSSAAVKNIWNMKTETKDTRVIFFNLPNKFLDDLGYPVPAALANIVSKSASLFENLDMPTFYENVAINLAEFLLSKDRKIERDTATRYVDAISKTLESADPNNKVEVWQANLNGYANFITSYGFNLVDVIDEAFQLFASGLIVLHDKL